MSPADSRKASPDLWADYDAARHLALDLADAETVTAIVGRSVQVTIKAKAVVDLLDLLCELLRERIEAEASGKAGGR